MIIVIDALNAHQFGDILDEMFKLRARVFGDRLGWEVEIRDGREIDRFDALDPAYLVGLDDDGQVVSCARLLQTTGPHMLAEVFSAILDGEPPLRSARIWESTRFCVDTQRLKANGGLAGISRATCEILIAINDYGMRSGITDVVTVIDPVMDRVLKRSGCAPYDYVGRQAPMGKVAALAALLDCTPERDRSIRDFSRIEGDVFLTDEEAAELFARSHARFEAIPLETEGSVTTKVSLSDLVGYCAAQLEEAKSSGERARADAVVQALLSAVGAKLPQGVGQIPTLPPTVH